MTRRRDQVFIDGVATFAGSTNSIYVHFLIYGGWLLVHLFGSLELQKRLGASVENISLVASLEAIFLAVFVLINQKRMNSLERKNADLHLQMSLLGEHEITRLAQLTDLIAKKLGVETAIVPDLEELKKDIHPTEILDRISRHES